MSNLISDLLDLPEAVRKGNFVQGFTDGIEKLDGRPARYLATGDDA